MNVPVDPESSVELLRRVRLGDVDALDRLLHRYLPPLEKWARGRLPRWARDLSDTQDLVQDTVLKTLRNLSAFEHRREGALQAYLRQAVMNRIQDDLRRARRRPALVDAQDDLPSGESSPLARAIGQEMLDRYEAALARLRETDRQAIIARVELGRSYEDIAAALGKPNPNAARVAVQRALLRLAGRMNQRSKKTTMNGS